MPKSQAVSRQAFTGHSPPVLSGVSFDVPKTLYQQWAKLFVGYSSPLPLDPYAVEQENLRRALAKTLIGFIPLLDIDYAPLEREWAAKITATCPVGSKRQVCMALYNTNARIHT
jgi:predicted alpha/beta hydrolase